MSDGDTALRDDTWRGIRRVTVQVSRGGALGTMAFDWHSVRHAAMEDGVCLVLGYNTACFLASLRWHGKKILINMDGIEWKRPKWALPVRAWFYLNEWLGAWLGHRLVADHPAIAEHLATRRPRGAITTIPYGADEVLASSAALLAPFRLESGRLPRLDRPDRARQQYPDDGRSILAPQARLRNSWCWAGWPTTIPIMPP